MENFGCRTSQADGDAIAAGLEVLGACPAEGISQTSVVVVNTCTVTAEADRDARAYIRRVQRANPLVRIVVTGCYAQRAPDEVAALPGVFAVVGNSHKNHVASIALGRALTEYAPSSETIAAHGFVPVESLESASKVNAARLSGGPAFVLTGDIFAHSDFQLPSLPAAAIDRLTENSAAHRTRPSLKIQDGCGNRCTFCVIPSTRGNSRSLPKQQVLDSVQRFVAAGGQELVISGINLGRWGRDLIPQERFEDLLTEILEMTELPRLRISSVEPMDWTDGLIALLRCWGKGLHPRLARHVHMPLQSGSDRVLRRMHRRYRPWHYAERLAKVSRCLPGSSHRRGRNGGLSRRDGGRISRELRFHRGPTLHVSALVSVFRPARHGWVGTPSSESSCSYGCPGAHGRHAWADRKEEFSFPVKIYRKTNERGHTGGLERNVRSAA